MPPPDLHSLLGQVRDLTQTYMAGKDPDSFKAFRDLVQLLLGHTVLPTGAAARLTRGPRNGVYVIGGQAGPTDPIKLTDGRYLRVAITLYLTKTDQGHRVKVESSNFQYQMDAEGERWIFRYDYVREPPDPHPSAHVHIRGTLTEPCLAAKQSLEDVHFPTSRVSIESVIRLLIEQFNVPPNTKPEVWRSLLTESETLFMQIAHKPASGPSR